MCLNSTVTTKSGGFMMVLVLCSAPLRVWILRTSLQPPEDFFSFTKWLFGGLNFNLGTSASEIKINGDAAASLQRRIKDNTWRKRAVCRPWLQPWLTAAGPLTYGCTLRDQTPSLLHFCAHRWEEDGHGGARSAVRAAAADGKSTRPRGTNIYLCALIFKEGSSSRLSSVI